MTRLLSYCILSLATVRLALASTDAEQMKGHFTAAEEEVRRAAVSGKPADFTGLDREARTIRSSVVEEEFTNEEQRKKLSRLGFTIKNAIFQGPLNLGSLEVPVTLHWEDCEFADRVIFSSSHFAAPVYLSGSKFTNKNTKVSFNNTRIDDLLAMNNVVFAGGAEFFQLRVKGNLFASQDVFANDTEEVRFDQADVQGQMFFGTATEENVTFRPSRFLGSLSLTDVKTLGLNLSGVTIDKDLDLRHADIQTVLNLDVGCFGQQVCGSTPPRLCLPKRIFLEGLSYKDLQPAVGCQLLTLIDHAEQYSARSYTELEGYYRTHAQPEDADAVFFHMKGKERENLEFLPRLWSDFLHFLVGYGRHPEYALYYCFGFVIFGALIFRSPANVVPRRNDDTSQRYNPFWYSFDLLTPFIDLHLADSWMPRQDWRFGCVYAHVHRILGWILVPIGIAAITGIIK